MADSTGMPRHSVSLTGVVFDSSQRVLAIQRADDHRWVPPGGVLELDETPEQGVVREVLEETGIVVKPEILVGVYKNMRLNVVSLAFRCHVVSGVPHTSVEARQVAWLTLDQARELMPKARFTRVIDALREDGPFVREHDGTDLLWATALHPHTCSRHSRTNARGKALGRTGSQELHPRVRHVPIPLGQEHLDVRLLLMRIERGAIGVHLVEHPSQRITLDTVRRVHQRSRLTLRDPLRRTLH